MTEPQPCDTSTSAELHDIDPALVAFLRQALCRWDAAEVAEAVTALAETTESALKARAVAETGAGSEGGWVKSYGGHEWVRVFTS